MADFLVIVEAEELLWLEISINPHDVPVFRLFGGINYPTEFFSGHLYDIILCFGDVNNDLIF